MELFLFRIFQMSQTRMKCFHLIWDTFFYNTKYFFLLPILGKIVFESDIIFKKHPIIIPN